MVKRIVLMVMVAAMMMVLMVPMSLAVEKRCHARPCYGTNKADVLLERRGDGVADKIFGKRGGDRINASRFNKDRDLLYGGRGDDRLNAQDGDGRDVVRGGPGSDVCYVDGGDSYRNCETVAVSG